MRFPVIAFAPLALLAAVVKAAPTTFGTLDVFVPEITSPVAGDVWAKGTSQTVKWETSSAPGQITNPIGEIYLRDVTNAIILLDAPLATGFDILNGEQVVTVPEVPSGPYQVVLFGDSGNWSPVFDIVD